jgi:hypothetical protein
MGVCLLTSSMVRPMRLNAEGARAEAHSQLLQQFLSYLCSITIPMLLVAAHEVTKASVDLP